jgi:hypothetical protein
MRVKLSRRAKEDLVMARHDQRQEGGAGEASNGDAAVPPPAVTAESLVQPMYEGGLADVEYEEI